MNGNEELSFVCSVEDLGPGERRIVGVDGTEIGVFNLDGEFHALHNECPHRGGPVCTGTVVDSLSAEWIEPGERVEKWMDGPPSLTCPWHGWEFDIATGKHLGDDTVSVETVDVVVEDGDVYVRRPEG